MCMEYSSQSPHANWYTSTNTARFGTRPERSVDYPNVIGIPKRCDEPFAIRFRERLLVFLLQTLHDVKSSGY